MRSTWLAGGRPPRLLRAGPPPLLVKVAPDLAEADKADVAAVALKLGVDGLVVSNTTLARPPEVSAHLHGGEVRRRRIEATASWLPRILTLPSCGPPGLPRRGGAPPL